MSLTDDRESRRRRKPDPDRVNSAANGSRPRRKRSGAGEVGHALRSAYERVIEEDIPPEMIDLLGKLG